MSLDFLAPEAQAALDRAKRAVPAGDELTPEVLAAAAYEVGQFKDELPQLAPYLADLPKVHRRAPKEVGVSASLKPIFRELQRSDMVTLEELMAALIRSAPLHEYLEHQGMQADELTKVNELLGGAPGAPPSEPEPPDTAWRGSSERREAIEALSSYGRMLTVGETPPRTMVGIDTHLVRLQKILRKMKGNNVIIIGQPGTGKTALVYEFARRIVIGDPSIHEALRDRDVFELSPTFLRSGASHVGEYDQRVSALVKVLEANPKIVLFVDEIHSLLQSGIHERSPFTDANEEFKRALGHGSISVIGATTTAEYRHYIAPDGALARRFGLLKIEPPSAQETVEVLRARRARYEDHYAPLRIPDGVIDRAVELAEERLPTQFQPAKSLQLLDEACALATMTDPPADELTDDAVFQALEDAVGHAVVQPGSLTLDAVRAELGAKIVGQDQALDEIAKVFVGGMSESWRDHDRPRGVFVFCGPTGVGKTETALALSKILGGGREALVRVDCNTLQGAQGDEGPLMNILLGAPPSYIGYVRGKGGVLSKVRDFPECVVLFDEVEKAHPAIGKVLLQILDEGRVHDHDDNLLDFRRSFIIFTTNAGVTYESTGTPIGFSAPGSSVDNAAGRPSPTASVDDVRNELRQQGYGEEFFGRNVDFIVFEGMERDEIETILSRQLEGLHSTAEFEGYELTWSDDFAEHLLAQWQPRFGVRFLTTILRHRVIEQLAIADAQGELAGVSRIHLDKMPDGPEGAALATRQVDGDTLTILLA